MLWGHRCFLELLKYVFVVTCLKMTELRIRCAKNWITDPEKAKQASKNSDFFPCCGLSPPFNVVCYVERHHKAQESLQIENRRDLFDVGGTKSMKRKKIKAQRASIVGFACLLCFFWTSNPIFCTSYSQLWHFQTRNNKYIF